jgi:hypothetical protein
MDGEAKKLPTVTRAEGVTLAERYLKRLCEHSFLSLWSYSSLFRDQKADGKGDGKELCDLLVVFGDDILIFSDKSCAFPDTGNARLDWSRWFRKAVMESAKQAWGAERWLRTHPNRVFLDRACTQPLPLGLPPASRMRVHRVVVAHNVANRCAAAFNGGSGSLLFDSGLTGKDHYHDVESCRPFYVGWIDQNLDFVHVLDDASLDIVLETRDTITDFVDYLRWKEDLLLSAKKRGVLVMHTGEEELLAHYLLTLADDGRHGFSLPENYNVLFLEEGEWAHFRSSPQRSAQLAADRVSYLWDELIETFNKNILGGTSYHGSTLLIADREKVMRFFGREPRIRRRMLAEALLGLVEKAKPAERTTRIVPPTSAGDPHYCFLALSNIFGRPDDEYRRVRANLLEALCLVTKLVYPAALDVVGFATEPGVDTVSRSEDALYFNARTWNEELEAQARRLQSDLGLLTNLTMSEKHFSEFPMPESRGRVEPGPNPRNKPCPCGSGKKYKRCHGR